MCVCVFHVGAAGLTLNCSFFSTKRIQIEGFENEYTRGSEMAKSTVPQCVGIYNPPITAHAYIQLPGCLIHECLQGILIMWEKWDEHDKES